MPTAYPYENADPFNLDQPSVKRSPSDASLARGTAMPMDWRQAPYATAPQRDMPTSTVMPKAPKQASREMAAAAPKPITWLYGNIGEERLADSITRAPKPDAAPPVNMYNGQRIARAKQADGGYQEDPNAPQVQARYGQAQDRSNLTEGERMKLLGSIQDRLNSLGPLNMASKRRLSSDLLGLQGDLLKSRQGQLGDADRQANDMTNANANRGQGADTFNSEMAEKGLLRRSESRSAAARLAFDREQGNFTNALRLDANRRANNQDVRAGEKQDNEFKAQRDKYESDIVESRAKAIADEQGITLDQARAQAQRGLADENLNTKQPNATTAAALGELGIRADLADKLNRGTSLGQYLGEAFSDSGRGFHVDDPKVDPTTLDPSSIEVGKRGGLVRVANALSRINPMTGFSNTFDPYYAQLPGKDGQDGPRTPISQAEYDEIIRRKRQFGPQE